MRDDGPKRVALVTGASRGIGKQIALELGREHHVVVNYLGSDVAAKEVAEMISTEGGSASTLQCDVGHPGEVDEMFAQIATGLGPVSILVNNAGVRSDGSCLTMSDAAFMQVLETDLFGPFLCMKRALRSMLETGWGRVVNLSSIAGLRAAPGQINYAASKAGLIAMTKTAAAEVGRKNITVNAVAPGLVDTDMTSGLPEERISDLLARTPTRKATPSEEVAAVVGFLCSERAASINGSVVVIDGGLTA